MLLKTSHTTVVWCFKCIFGLIPTALFCNNFYSHSHYPLTPPKLFARVQITKEAAKAHNNETNVFYCTVSIVQDIHMWFPVQRWSVEASQISKNSLSFLAGLSSISVPMDKRYLNYFMVRIVALSSLGFNKILSYI